MSDESPDLETAQDIPGPKAAAVVRRWAREIEKAEKHAKKWMDRGQKVVDRYRDDKKAMESSDEVEGGRKFSLLWSNVETLKPALYNRDPHPDIRRRFADKLPAARVASEIIERCVSVNMDLTDFSAAIKCARDDRLLPGRGVCWIRYEPEYEDALDGDGQSFQRVASELVYLDYVYWKDFLHGPAKQWKHVPWVARRLRLTRSQLVERFGKVGKKIELHTDDKEDKDEETFRKGEVWEIWNREDRRVYWICTTYRDGPLDVKDDFLQLRGFFPCPKPLYSSLTTENLIPVPDYCQYQDQAEEIDLLTSRICLVTEAIRVAGVYPADQPELAQLVGPMAGVENAMIPSTNWAQFMAKGGFEAAVQFLPIDTLSRVLHELYEARDRLLQQVYEITGIADIIRGASKASETATAQRIKGNFATLRLDEMQRDVARFARDGIRMVAEVISEQFAPETLIAMSGADQLPEVMKEQEAFEQARAEYAQAIQAQMQPQIGQMQPQQPLMTAVQ